MTMRTYQHFSCVLGHTGMEALSRGCHRRYIGVDRVGQLRQVSGLRTPAVNNGDFPRA